MDVPILIDDEENEVEDLVVSFFKDGVNRHEHGWGIGSGYDFESGDSISIMASTEDGSESVILSMSIDQIQDLMDGIHRDLGIRFRHLDLGFRNRQAAGIPEPKAARVN